MRTQQYTTDINGSKANSDVISWLINNKNKLIL